MFTFAKFCRLCCKNTQFLVNIAETDLENISYYDKLKKIIPQIVTDENTENFPTWLCVICREELNESYTFYEKCLLTHQLLKLYSRKLNSTNTIPNTIKIENVTLNAQLNCIPEKFNESEFQINFTLNDPVSIKEEPDIFDEDTRSLNEYSNESDSESAISIVKNEIPGTEEEELNFKMYLKDILTSNTSNNEEKDLPNNSHDEANVNQNLVENNIDSNVDNVREENEENTSVITENIQYEGNDQVRSNLRRKSTSFSGDENDAAKKMKSSLDSTTISNSSQEDVLNDNNLIINNNNVPLRNEDFAGKPTNIVAPLILKLPKTYSVNDYPTKITEVSNIQNIENTTSLINTESTTTNSNQLYNSKRENVESTLNYEQNSWPTVSQAFNVHKNYEKLRNQKELSVDELLYLNYLSEILNKTIDFGSKQGHDIFRNNLCHICGISFESRTKFTDHLNKHESPADGKYVCKYCGKKYRSQRPYIKHMFSLHHTSYKCHVCLEEFSSTQNLTNHKAVHIENNTITGPKANAGSRELRRFTCNLCDKNFILFSKYQIHMEQHYNENQQSNSNY